jgi:DNA-binding transcriptional ArsR family regulator
MTEDLTAADASDAPDAVRLDARSLRGLAHPLRVRLLGLLRQDGPATASGLAAVVGESSGVTSYHLRQLATYGFVVEDDAPHASKRERWWKAAHRTTILEPLAEADPGTQALVDEYLRSVAGAYADRVLRFADGITTTRDLLGEGWRDLGDMSDWWLELTPDEAEEVSRRLHAAMAGYVRSDPSRPRRQGSERVVVQIQVMPTVTVGEEVAP